MGGGIVVIFSLPKIDELQIMCDTDHCRVENPIKYLTTNNQPYFTAMLV